MWWAFPGAESFTVILVLFGIGMLGMELSQIFVNSMLPEICSEKDIGRVSGNGWSLGYVGGLLLLFITLLFFAENNVALHFWDTLLYLGWMQVFVRGLEQWGH